MIVTNIGCLSQLLEITTQSQRGRFISPPGKSEPETSCSSYRRKLAYPFPRQVQLAGSVKTVNYNCAILDYPQSAPSFHAHRSLLTIGRLCVQEAPATSSKYPQEPSCRDVQRAVLERHACQQINVEFVEVALTCIDVKYGRRHIIRLLEALCG